MGKRGGDRVCGKTGRLSVKHNAEAKPAAGYARLIWTLVMVRALTVRTVNW